VSNSPSGTFISYSTSPGHVANDGEGKNSPYTKALLENISKLLLESVHTKKPESVKSKMPLNPAFGYTAAKGHNRDVVAADMGTSKLFRRIRHCVPYSFPSLSWQLDQRLVIGYLLPVIRLCRRPPLSLSSRCCQSKIYPLISPSSGHSYHYRNIHL